MCVLPVISASPAGIYVVIDIVLVVLEHRLRAHPLILVHLPIGQPNPIGALGGQLDHGTSVQGGGQTLFAI